jgi:hypothetical protein
VSAAAAAVAVVVVVAAAAAAGKGKGKNKGKVKGVRCNGRVARRPEATAVPRPERPTACVAVGSAPNRTPQALARSVAVRLVHSRFGPNG